MSGRAPGTQVAQYQQNAPVRLTDVIFYQPVDDLAVNFVMANYVGIDCINSQFDYLPAFYKQYYQSYPTLRETIKAVGTAGYAKATRYSEIIPTATKSYIAAVRGVNSALSHPELRSHDSTLAAILLLGMFEMLVMPRNRGFNNLTNHLNGALSVAALLMERKEPSEFSVKVLQSTYHAVIVNCWIQNIELPPALFSIQKHVAHLAASSSKTQMEYLELIVMLIQFRQDVEKGRCSTPGGIIARAAAIDHGMKSFTDNIPVDAQFTAVSGAPDQERTLNGYYHIYRRNFTAHFWNNIRWTRMQLHAHISRQCLHILKMHTPGTDSVAKVATQLERSKNQIRYLAAEICATVPQLASYLDQVHTSTPTLLSDPYSDDEIAGTTPSSSTSDDNSVTSSSKDKRRSPKQFTTRDQPYATDAQNAPRPSSHYHLMFQLHKLATTPDLPDNMYRWIENRIQWVEGVADQDDKKLLRTMLDCAPSGAFPFFVNK
jgi:hypothetical protein